uniref:Uncharacterized protein n=1 Tax=Timema poppense TaxID=170557 RepID=A0A7R9DA98_TIMPO|nr:unnamed protein product [Timema poppensis]
MLVRRHRILMSRGIQLGTGKGRVTSSMPGIVPITRFSGQMVLGVTLVLDWSVDDREIEDKSLDVVWMEANQLVKEGSCLKRSMIICQEKCQVEKSTAKIILELHGSSKPVLCSCDVSIIHCQHAQIEGDRAPKPFLMSQHWME